MFARLARVPITGHRRFPHLVRSLPTRLTCKSPRSFIVWGQQDCGISLPADGPTKLDPMHSSPTRSRSKVASNRVAAQLIPILVSLQLCGCTDDIDAVREIQAQRQVRMQAESQQDHLGEVFRLLNDFIELNPEQARRQITFHLNRWREGRSFESEQASTMIRTVSDVLPAESAKQRISRDNHTPSDVDHLRNSFLFRRIVEWADHPRSDDPLLASWLTKMEQQLGEEQVDQLRTAARLFDWTVRNIAFEQRELPEPSPQIDPILAAVVQQPPPFSLGMTFRGAGYRQTDYQTLWRGTGDSLQRAGVFTQLCRQASIPAFLLAIQSTDTGQLNPWCVGVMIGGEIYLFEPDLSIYIPGPNQEGIATLSQARRDASVLRRLNAPGFFDYPFSKADVQQCVALLNVLPEAISPRMKQLESGLTGDRRMRLFVDVDQLAKEIDEVSGIAGVRLWQVPLLAEVYKRDVEKAAERDPRFGFWYMSNWGILESPSIGRLTKGRWRHLLGQFDSDDEEGTKGARILYLAQRAPEFEIEDLEIDVDLQQAYGIRRELGVDSAIYNLQIQQAQIMMRLGKRTATYWISLIQYDDERYDTAKTWFSKRVLDEQQLSHWEPAARYNLARTVERLGDVDRAIELYRTDGDPQEHGNRIRARLVAKAAAE
jgi:tetratricopeptide (TPR) repeat protein